MATVLDYNLSTNSLSISSSTGSKPVIVPVAGSGIDNNFSVPQTFGAAIIQPASAGANNQTPFLQAGDMIGAYVVDGLLDTVPSTASLTSTMPGGTAYVQGGSVLQRVVSPGATYTYAASSDTYVDLSYTGVLTYSAVANGATAPGVAANSLLLEKVVTSATAITSVVPYNNTQGANGFSNSSFGKNALQSNTTGRNNSAQGTSALQSNTTGLNNSAQGAGALQSNTTGNNNSAQGSYALLYNTTGSNNSAQGSYALQSNTTGSNNSAQGTSALQSNTTGLNNSAQGAYALLYNTTGSNNSAHGTGALQSNTTGNFLVGVGYNVQPLTDNDTNEIIIGSNLTGYGSHTTRIGGSAGFYTDGRLVPAGGSSLNMQTLDASTTAGAITIAAAQMLANYFVDGATQTAAFTITTDTAANIYAAAPGLVGSSFVFRIFNNDQSTTGYAATLAAGTGVTIGTTLPNPPVPKGSWCDYLAIYISVGASPAITINAVGMGTF